MEKNKIMRYSIQLAYLKRLSDEKLIDMKEFVTIKEKLMRDYGIVSNLQT